MAFPFRGSCFCCFVKHGGIYLLIKIRMLIQNKYYIIEIRFNCFFFATVENEGEKYRIKNRK